MLAPTALVLETKVMIAYVLFGTRKKILERIKASINSTSFGELFMALSKSHQLTMRWKLYQLWKLKKKCQLMESKTRLL